MSDMDHLELLAGELPLHRAYEGPDREKPPMSVLSSVLATQFDQRLLDGLGERERHRLRVLLGASQYQPGLGKRVFEVVNAATHVTRVAGIDDHEQLPDGRPIQPSD